MANRIQYRRDTKARWLSVNPILMEGEVGYETDTHCGKVGDGIHTYSELPYERGTVIGSITNELGDSEELVLSQKITTNTFKKLQFQTLLTNEDYFYINREGVNVTYEGCDNKIALILVPTKECTFYGLCENNPSFPSFTFLSENLEFLGNYFALPSDSISDNFNFTFIPENIPIPKNTKYIGVCYVESKNLRIDSNEALSCIPYSVKKLILENKPRINTLFLSEKENFEDYNNGLKELYIQLNNKTLLKLPLKILLFNNGDNSNKGLEVRDNDDTIIAYADELNNGYNKIENQNLILETVIDFTNIKLYRLEFLNVLENSYDIDFSPTIKAIHLENQTSILKGKKIIYNGDSICEGRDNNGGSYPLLISELTGCLFENRAISGGILSGSTPSGVNPDRCIVNDIVNMSDDADLICFEGGINDYWNDIPLGNFIENDYNSDLDETSLIGSLESIIRQAINKWVGKPICFIITHKIKDTVYNTNKAGYTFKEAHDKILSLLKKYSIPVYDAFENSGLNAYNDIQNNTFLTAGANVTDGGDGCHPNKEGYLNYYVPQLIKLFESLIRI